MTLTNRYFGGVVFVVADHLTDGMQSRGRVLDINCAGEEAMASLQQKIEAYWELPQEESRAFARYDSKLDIYAGYIADKATAAFLALYVGFVFVIACAAILAVQQLSEAEDNKERYRLLGKLGAETRMLNRALFRQTLCSFLLPLMLAVVHAAVGLVAVFRLLSEFGQIDIASSLVAMSCFILLIYGAYFLLTYAGSKRIIRP